MPTRTVVQELCDVCYAGDSGAETEAIHRIRFSWQGRDYLLLTCEEHAGPIRDQLQQLSELATPDDGRRRPTVVSLPRQPRASASRGAASATKTAFSGLSAEEKERFRAWAALPNARRIADSRVEEWIAAGKP